VVSADARTFRDLAQMLGFMHHESERRCDGVRQQQLDLAPGRDPRVCLVIGRPPKMSLNDVEPERGED
jgi:hypothetical protein